MTQPASRRRAWPALLLAAAMLAAGGPAALAQEAPEDGAESTPVTSPAPSLEPAASTSPTPDPAFASVALRTVLLTDDLEETVYLADDGVVPGRCLYAVEKDGQVWLIDRVDGSLMYPDPFLDLSKGVASGPEQGLHSIAFHPDFRKNGRFFARWDNRNGNAVVAEFKGKACRPAPRKGRKIEQTWVNVKQQFPNNNAGWIGFGPDGMLYVTLGDGGGGPPGDAAGNGQSRTSPLAKILRIDVGRQDGLAQGNPYVTVVNKNNKTKLKKRGGNYPRTWVMGVRDPRRASFDRETGDFWFGDVGQNHYDRPGWEEIDFVPADSVRSGQPAPNFGWSHVEGVDTCHPRLPECDPEAYTAPVYAYEKRPGGAITGGYVYRGEAIKRLQGVYLFSDFIEGTIWGLDAEAVRAGDDVTAYPLMSAPQGFVSFGQDDDGELYVVALEGSIYRLSALAR